MEKLGVFDIEKNERPPRIYSFDEKEWVKKEISNGKYLKHAYIPELLESADKLIFLPCLKTHFKSQFTGSLKLSMGCIKPYERVSFHASNIQEKIAELSSLMAPGLIIMDARKCFITGGPFKGDMRESDLILASDDRVAIDVEGIKIIQSFDGNSLRGINPWELPQIKRATELNIGSNSEKDYEITQ